MAGGRPGVVACTSAPDLVSPSVTRVSATPSAFVVLWIEERVATPLATDQRTVAPEIARPSSAATRTRRGSGAASPGRAP